MGVPCERLCECGLKPAKDCRLTLSCWVGSGEPRLGLDNACSEEGVRRQLVRGLMQIKGPCDIPHLKNTFISNQVIKVTFYFGELPSRKWVDIFDSRRGCSDCSVTGAARGRTHLNHLVPPPCPLRSQIPPHHTWRGWWGRMLVPGMNWMVFWLGSWF